MEAESSYDEKNEWLWEDLTSAAEETLDVQPEELSEGKLMAINEYFGHDEKDADGPDEMTPAKTFTLKKFSEIFHDLGKAKDKMLGSDLWKEYDNSPKLRKDACSIL